MHLHEQSALSVLARKPDKKKSEKGVLLRGRKRAARPEQLLRFRMIGVPFGKFCKSVIGNAAALGNKIVQPTRQRLQKVVERADAHTRRRAELFQIPIVRIIELIGAEGRRNQRSAVFAVRRKIVRGIVRGCHELHAELLQKPAHRDGFFVRLPVNARRAPGVEGLVDPVDAPKLEMRPIVERISGEQGQNARIRRKFFLPACVARDIFFFHAAQPHGAPLIVIAREPQFADVGKTRIRSDHVLIEMAMIVDDGKFRHRIPDLFRAPGM